ncbi:MAG: hypothetical protein IJR00_03245 [Lachnospiraceae bacterium]|nr:hypothetical protein [Lachnospiraceae bacterium]
MRITNKIMQNNSLYNINNNKVTENDVSTAIMTGKKINRPSEDPVIAIRALRLRANVSELSQYYEKNVKDAAAWLQVTESALTSISGDDSVLVDLKKLVNAGPDKYKTLSDWQSIVTQIEQLSNEYYNVGNVDYAGRYAFTGYRTNTSLSFMEDTSKKYEDIQDEFNAKSIDTSDRVTSTGEFANGDELSNAMLESNVELYTVGRLRLSYDRLDITRNFDPDADPPEFELKYRENMAVSAASTVLPSSANVDMVNLSFTTADGVSHTVHLPVNDGSGKDGSGNLTTITVTNPDGTEETYTASKDSTDGTYSVTCNIDGTDYGPFKVNAKGVIYAGSDQNKPVDFPDSTNYPGILKATTTVTQAKVTEVKMTPETGSLASQETIYIPLADETKQPYTMKINQGSGAGYTVTVNTDGTYTLTGDCNNKDGDPAKSVVQLNSGGAVHSSYVETTLKPMAVIDATDSADSIDAMYRDLYDTYIGTPTTFDNQFIVNANTGEILFSKQLNDKLTALQDIINANTLNAVYDKTNFVKGDTRPEHLFACTNEGIKYNIGTAGHTMEYDVGYNQKIEVNTTANDVFTNDVKRDAEDLRRILDQMTDVNNKINILKQELANTTVTTEQESIQKEIYAAQKAYDYLTDIMKDEFGAKITGVTKAIDMANNAVTVNGTRSKRLDLIESRLMDQTATFKELQSENEDVDLAEAGTMLAMARLTYEASLQATGKIMTTSLMDYI